jgi:hypothetical protein
MENTLRIRNQHHARDGGERARVGVQKCAAAPEILVSESSECGNSECEGRRHARMSRLVRRGEKICGSWKETGNDAEKR